MRHARMKMWAFFILVFATVMGADATAWLTLEQFGGEAYYKRFDGGLTYTPYSADPAIVEGLDLPEGRHYTRIRYTGPEPVFHERDLGKSFCGLFMHKNPDVPDRQHPDLFYPNIVGSRYAKVVRVLDGKTIIVDFEFNGGAREKPRIAENRKGYIFFDNSDAWAALMAEFTRPENTQTEIRLRAHARKGHLQATYVIPQNSTVPLPDKPMTLWTGTARKARVKVGVEDYFQWDRLHGQPLYRRGVLFQPAANDHNIIIHNIAWTPVHRVIAETATAGLAFFAAPSAAAPCERIIAIINNTALDERREIEAAGALTDECFRCPGLGLIYSGGRYAGEGLQEDVVGYQYILLKNFEHTGSGLMDLKSNSGAGNYLVMENVSTDFISEQYQNPTAVLVDGRFTADKSGLHPEIVKRGYYPDKVFEITSGHSFNQIDTGYHIHGWGNAANIIQIDRFAFLLGNDATWRIYEVLHSEGQPMFRWDLPREPNTTWIRTAQKHMVVQQIPRVGQRYVISRDYTVEDTEPFRSPKTIAPDMVRGFVNWPLVLRKTIGHQDAEKFGHPQLDPARDVPLHSKPIQLQAGDQFRIPGREGELYTVITQDRGPYPQFPHEFYYNMDGYLYTRHKLDKPLPEELPIAFEIEMVTSTSEYLLDGEVRPAWLIYKANKYWPTTTETRFGDEAIRESYHWGQVSYNHKEMSIWARNVQHNGYYRQSFTPHDQSAFEIKDPDNGESLTVNRLARYSGGTTLINCSGFGDQFDAAIHDLVMRDKILRSLGRALPDNQKAKYRLYQCQEVAVVRIQDSSHLIEVHDTVEGAPDMPAACRALIDSLPSERGQAHDAL